MQSDQVIAITYHYLRKECFDGKVKLHGLDFSEFRRQVESLLSAYHPLTLDEFRDYVCAGRALKKKGVIFTFDDGLKEHYSEAFTYLKGKGIPGFFFIPTRAVAEQAVLSTHKRHILIGLLGESAFIDRFLAELKSSDPEFNLDALAPVAKAREASRWGNNQEKQFKYYLNYGANQALNDIILSKIFSDEFGDEAKAARAFYLSKEELVQMKVGGMEIGGHSNCHDALAPMTCTRQEEDVGLCRRFLTETLGDIPMPFSYPFGKPGISFSAFTEEAVEKAGFYCGFSTEKGGIDLANSPYRLRRYDANDADGLVPARF